jgi:hypothetical protein
MMFEKTILFPEHFEGFFVKLPQYLHDFLETWPLV